MIRSTNLAKIHITKAIAEAGIDQMWSFWPSKYIYLL